MEKITCGFVIYGVDYIRDHIENIKQWREMNPEIVFEITTILLKDETEDIINEITKGFTVHYINEPIVIWLRDQLQKYHLPIHFLSDVMRWFCLEKLFMNSDTDFLLEADVICLKPQWLIESIPKLEDGLTIFGKDRSCIVIHNNGDTLSTIVNMFRNVYHLLILENVFVGNFMNKITGESEDIVISYLNQLDYDKLMEIDIELRSTEKDKIDFINDLPRSILGIGIRYGFGIHIIDPGPEGVDYIHLAEKQWAGKKIKRTKRKRTKRKRTKRRKN